MIHHKKQVVLHSVPYFLLPLPIYKAIPHTLLLQTIILFYNPFISEKRIGVNTFTLGSFIVTFCAPKFIGVIVGSLVYRNKLPLFWRKWKKRNEKERSQLYLGCIHYKWILFYFKLHIKTVFFTFSLFHYNVTKTYKYLAMQLSLHKHNCNRRTKIIKM